MRWEELRAQGQTPSAEELCRDHPELLEQFRDVLTALKFMDGVLDSATRSVADPFRRTLPARPEGARPDVPGYEILGELGRGGIGVVYLARSVRLQRLVALKVPKEGSLADATERARFRREAQAMARLDHPHIVPVYEEGEHAGRPYFTMKYLKGGSLAEQIPALAADPRRAVTLLERVARAVHYSHQAQVLHRDLKPQNILLDEQGAPYVSDFGLAKILEPGLEVTTRGAVMGTLPYMAPEQVQGHHHRIGNGTDIWALGVILYEVLTGRRPFAGEERSEVTSKILSEHPAPLRSLRPDLEQGLEAVVGRCLQKEPAARYASAGALADDLAAYLRGDLPVAQPHGRWPIWRRLVRHRVTVLAAGLLAALGLALAFAGFNLFGNRREPPPRKDEPAGETLLGPQGLPAAFHWLARDKTATLAESPDGMCSLSTPKLALVQLRANVPWPRFRLAAEVRHNQSVDGAAGLFLGSRDLPVDKTDYHFFCKLGFADKGQFKERVSLDFVKCPVLFPDAFSPVTLGGIPFPPESRLAKEPADGWRKLNISVTEEEIRALWEHHTVARTTLDSVRRRGEMFLQFPAGEWKDLAHLGVGLFVYRGSASFRNVAVSPLP
jgi:hypothetical protein